jgi:hypothetical protein
MATILKAGNVASGAQITSDATGILEIRTGTGAGTTAITVGTDQAVTFAAGTTINGITVGRGAGAVSTNTAVGASALAATTGSSSNNTAVGSSAGAALTSGARNTALGFNALLLNTTGTENTAVGGNALNKSTTASSNTAVGYVALFENTTGTNNVGVGLGALQNNTTASHNTAVGFQAGLTNTVSSFNTFLGVQAGALYNGANANTWNTCVGGQAGYFLTTGTYNSFLGTQAGQVMTTGSKNTIVGAYNGNQGGLDIRTSSNNIVLSDGDGNPQARQQGAGGWFQANNSASWSVVSDARIKKNVQTITNGLAVITSLRPVEFDYILKEKHDIGFIAQEYEQVLPDQVSLDDTGSEEIKALTSGEPVKGVQQNLVPYLVAAIKELKAEIDALKGQS